MGKCNIEFNPNRVFSSLTKLTLKYTDENKIDRLDALSVEELTAMYSELMDILNSKFFSGHIISSFQTDDFRSMWDSAVMALTSMRMTELGVMVYDDMNPNDVFDMMLETYPKLKEAKKPEPPVEPQVPPKEAPIKEKKDSQQMELDFANPVDTQDGKGNEKTEVTNEEDGDSNTNTESEEGYLSDEDAEKDIASSFELIVQGEVKESPGFLKTIPQIIEQLMPEESAKMQEDIINFYKELMAKNWIDTQVSAAGDVIGFQNPENVIEFVRQRLRDDVYNLMKSTTQGTYKLYNLRDNTAPVSEVLFVGPNTKIPDTTLVKENEPFGSFYTHNTVENSNGIEGKMTIFQLNPAYADDPEVASGIVLSALAEQLKIPGLTSDEVIQEISANYEVEYVANDDVKTIEDESLKKYLMFANILQQEQSPGKYVIDSFVYYFHHGIGQGLAEKTRTGYVAKDGTVSQEDQDSKRTKMSKETTPRVTLVEADAEDPDSKGMIDKVSQNKKDPYLTVEDFNLVSDDLTANATNTEQLKKYLRLQMKDKNNPRKDIYASIYYRFFSDKDYLMKEYDSVTGSHTDYIRHRSIESISKLQGFDGGTNEDIVNRIAEGKDVTLSDTLAPTTDYNNNMLSNNIESMVTSILSNVPNERILFDGERVLLSNTRGGDVVARYHADLLHNFAHYDTSVNSRDEVSRGYRIRDKWFRRMKSRFRKRDITIDGKAGVEITIKLPQEKEKIVITALNNEDASYGIPITIQSITNGAMSKAGLTAIFKHIGIPESYFDHDTLNHIEEVFGRVDKKKEYHGKYPVENYFTNIVYQLLQGSKTGQLPNTFDRTIWGFNDQMEEVMNPIMGDTAKKFVRSYKGDKLAVQAPGSKVRKFYGVLTIAKTSGGHNINAGGYLASSQAEVKGIFSKMGFKSGDITKGNFDMTELENADYLIQRAFFQRLDQTNFTNALVQVGAMSDRTDIPLLDIQGKSSANGYIVFPTTIENELNRKTLANQWLTSKYNYHRQLEGSILRRWRAVLNKEGITAEINSINDLQKVLQNVKLPFDRISKNFDLVKNVHIVKDKNGNAAVAKGVLNNINVFRNQEEATLMSNWNRLLIANGPDGKVPHLDTMQELIEYLETTAEEISAARELDPTLKNWLTDMLSGIPVDMRKDIGLVLTPSGRITLSIKKMKSISQLKNNKAAETYLRTTKGAFQQHLLNIGFDWRVIDDDTVRILAAKLPGELHVGKRVTDADRRLAYQILVDAYFFNQSTLGQEALNIYTGGTFQYNATKENAATGTVSYFSINDQKASKNIDPANARRETVDKIKKLPYEQRVPALIKAGIIASNKTYQLGKRFPIIVNINGKKIPFYRSSEGTSGKDAGRWYPFFGFGRNKADTNDWLIKGTVEGMNKGHGSPALQEYSAILNEVLDWDNDLDANNLSQHPFLKDSLENVGSLQEFNQELFGESDLQIFNTGDGKSSKWILQQATELGIAYNNERADTDVDANRGVIKSDGSLNVEEILRQTDNVLKLREKWAPGLGKPGKAPKAAALADQYENDHRWVWMARVRESGLSKKEQARILLMDDIATLNDEAFIDQVKRNAAIGTTGQSPSLVADNDYGLKITKYSNNITFNDPAKFYKIAGAALKVRADLYDAVQMGHPLYFLKLNNSLGNAESNYRFDGAPVKDITNGVTRDGFTIYQKKATFDMFNNDILREGTPELRDLFVRMNTAVKFGNISIMVPRTDVDGLLTNPYEYSTKVDAEMWATNGVALGVMFDNDDGKEITAQQVLEKVRRGDYDVKEFEADLERGRYTTDRVAKTFDNLQELWEHFGSTNNDNAWKDVGSIIGNFSGIAFKKGDRFGPEIAKLTTAEYPLRNSYVEKAGMKTQEKTGSQNLMDPEDLTNPFERDSALTNSDGSPRYYPVSNDGHLVILQAEHGTDTTSENPARLGADMESDRDNNTVALITQIINANINQGRSVAESIKIGKALGTLSEIMTEMLKKEIETKAKKIAAKKAPDDVDTDELEAKIERYFLDADIVSRSDKIEYDEFTEKYEDIRPYINEAYRESAKESLIKSLAKRGEDPGVAAELIEMDDADVSFDLLQIQPLVHQVILSQFNKAGVRYRFAGGQFVVAPSEHFVRTYSLGPIKNLKRTELNNKIYNGTYSELELLDIKNTTGIDFSPVRMTDKSLARHTHTDLVIVKDSSPWGVRAESMVMPINEVRFQLREVWEEGTKTETFEEYYTDFMLKNTETRLHQFGAVEQEKEEAGENLKWIQYLRSDGVELKETDEYLSFHLSKEIPKNSHSHRIRGEELIPENEVGEHYFLLQDKALGFVPKTMAKMYYFSEAMDLDYGTQSTPAERQINSISDYDVAADKLATRWSPIEEEEFDAWYAEQINDPASKAQLANRVYTFALNQGEHYESKFKVVIEDMLRDDDGEHKWSIVPAEFYLPSMHKETLLIRDTDTMNTFNGDGVEPDVNSLVKMGIIGIKDTFDVDKNFLKDEVNVKLRKMLESDELSDEQKTVLKTYIDRKSDQLEHLRGVYSERIAEDLIGSGKFDFEELVKQSIDKSPINAVISEIKGRLLKLPYGGDRMVNGNKINGSAWYTLHQDLLSELYKFKKKHGDNADAAFVINGKFHDFFRVNAIPTVPSTAIDDFIANRSYILANNFNAARDFISARIPAQGKQSYMAGRIKNFINSTKNSVYGPIEMLIITGADYDIDKQNMMTWAMDIDGEIIDWKDYTPTRLADDVPFGVESKLILTNRIEEGRKAIKALPQYKNIDNYAEKTQKRLKKEIRRVTAAFERAEYERFASAVQNSVVFNLMETIKDPVNALEAATPVAMETVRSLKEKANYMNIPADSDGDQFLDSREHTYAEDPSAMMRYEFINGSGKSGIGIFASDLKGYDSVYYVMMNSQAPEDVVNIKFSSHFNKLPYDKNIKSTNDSSGSMYEDVNEYLEKHGQTARLDAVQFIKFVDGKPVVQNIDTIANAGYIKTVDEELGDQKLVTYADASEEALELKNKIKKMKTKEEQVAAILKYTDQLAAFDKMLVEPQAWADLSELLSAATDNAKELILAKIGANNTTNSIISTMVRLGVPLGDAIGLIQEITHWADGKTEEDVTEEDLKIRNIFNSVIDDKDIVQQRTSEVETFSNLETAIKKALPEDPNKYYGDADYETNGEAIVRNPLYRLLPFVQIQAEFGTWSRIVSANQGIPIPEYDGWKWVAGIEQNINRTVRDYERDNKINEGNPFVFNLESFVKKSKASQLDENVEMDPYVEEIISRYNEAKAGLNIPFLLYKSPQYFNYITTLFDANNVVGHISSISDTVDTLLKRVMEKEDIRVNKIEDRDYRGVRNYIHGVGVDMYFKQQQEVSTLKNFYGYNFKLSNVESDGEYQGRVDFIRLMPDIVRDAIDTLKKNGHGENTFLTSLRTDREIVDYVTQMSIPILKGPDVRNSSPNKIAELRLESNRLKKIAPELHRALFLYSLIVNKGQYGGGSFASLMGVDRFKPWSRFLKDSMDNINANVLKFTKDENDSSYWRLILNNSNLIKEESTNKKENLKRRKEDRARADKRSRNKELEHGHIDEDPATMNEGDEMPEELDADGKPIDIKSQDWAAKARQNYSTWYLRQRKRKDLKRDEPYMPDLIRSKETGLIYKWHRTLRTWVPYIQKYPTFTIPYQSEAGGSIRGKTGFDYGWEIKHATNTITILAYVDADLKKEILANRVPEFKVSPSKEEDPGDFVAADTTALMAVEGQPTPKVYIIKENNIYKLVTDKTIKSMIGESRSDVLLDGPRMGILHSVGERAPKTDVTKAYYKLGDRHYVTDDGREGMEAALFKIGPLDLATSKSTAIWSKVYFNDLADKWTQTKSPEDYTLIDVNRAYSDMRERMIYLEMRANGDIEHYSDASILLAVQSKGKGALKKAYILAAETIGKVISSEPHSIKKIRAVQNAEKIFESHFSGRGLDEDVWITQLNKIELPSPERSISAVDELLRNRTAMSQLNVEELKDFLDNEVQVGTFPEYINNVLLTNSRYQIYEGSDNRVYLSPKARAENDVAESMMKQVLDEYGKVEPKKQKVFVPSDMRNHFHSRAGRETLANMADHFNRIFPGTKFEVSNTKAIEEFYGIKDARDVKAFVNNGTVVFNADLMTMDTPFHEYTHVYFEYLKKEDPLLFERLIKQALDSPLREEIENKYRGLSDVDLGEEILAELVSRSMKGDLDPNGKFKDIENELSGGGRFGKIKRFFRNLMNKLFGIKTEDAKYELNMNDSLDTIVGKIGSKLAYSKNSMLSNFRPTTIKMVELSRMGSSLDMVEAKKVLEEAGYIQYVCI